MNQSRISQIMENEGTEEVLQKERIEYLGDQQAQKNEIIDQQLQQFKEDMREDFCNIISNQENVETKNESNNNNNISSSEFDKKCQIKNELKKISNSIREDQKSNQKLTSDQFFRKEKSFLFSTIDKDHVEPERTQMPEIQQSIIHKTAFKNVNVGLSNINLKNKLNPKMINSLKNIEKNQGKLLNQKLISQIFFNQKEDYIMQLFGDDSLKLQNENSLNNNGYDKSQKQQQLSDQQVRNYLLKGGLTCNLKQNQEFLQIRKQLEQESLQILSMLKEQKNNKLINILSEIENDDMDVKLSIRQKLIQSMQEQQL